MMGLDIFFDFFEKNVDGMGVVADNYNSFVGNGVVGNIFVGIVNSTAGDTK
jgi:hypothetical protein